MIMNFFVIPSLQHIALVKTAALLWNQQDIRALVTEFWNSPFPQLSPTMFSPFIMCSEREKKWPKIQDQVINKMAQLTIPTCLKEKLIGYIQPIGIQILKWMMYHLKFCSFNLALPNEFCWTSQGTVDKKKTAEVLIRDESIDIIIRYKLACLYCLEDAIPILFHKIPRREKKLFINDKKKYFVMILVAFWTDGIRSEDNRLNYGLSTCQYMFSFAVETGNKAATEYFLQKLDLNEEFLLNTVVNVAKKHGQCKMAEPDREYYEEVLCFLMSNMNGDQQLALFQQCPQEVVYCLLDWPFQSLFVETVQFLWNFLPKWYYFWVFYQIVQKEFFGYKDYNYRKAFRDVWQHIPDADKSFIINVDRTPDMLDMLLRIKDKENFELMIQSATPTEKNKFIFSDRGFYFCRNMINREEWDSVKFFVQLLISSKNEMIKFKKEFEERIQARVALHQRNKRAEAKGYWDQFSRILDEFIRGYDKRDADEGETSSAKRLCNVEFKDVMYSAKKKL